MSRFINSVDVVNDDILAASIIERTITEYRDDQVRSLGLRAFYGCTELEVVDTPNIKTIADSVYNGCSKLIHA